MTLLFMIGRDKAEVREVELSEFTSSNRMMIKTIIKTTYLSIVQTGKKNVKSLDNNKKTIKDEIEKNEIILIVIEH